MLTYCYVINWITANHALWHHGKQKQYKGSDVLFLRRQSVDIKNR